ncbi:MAG: alpha/beta hydrolase [Actinomycetota bacterium]
MVAVIASCGTTNTTTPTSADTTIANSPTTTPVDTLPTTTLASSSSIPQPPVQPITWSACKGSAKVKCATLEVPYDYENPSLGSFTLSVRMRPAGKSPSVGPLFVNRGGPGAESASMATDAEFYFSKRLIDNFDIVTFDPRGTGASEPHVDCVEEVDSYFAADITYDTPEERQRLINDAQAFNDACEAKSGEILPYISTIASARDIDTLRRALGYDKISYFGFSYGSDLGATWARFFPNTVRAAVFDGASDPNASYLQAGLDQAAGFERELNAFFADCASRKTCPAYNNGDPAALFDEMMRRVERDPLFVNDKRTLVTSTVAYTAVADAMYSSALWPTLAEAIADATKKPIADGTGLLALYDDYYQRRPDGSYDNLLEAFIAISCLDDNGDETVDDVEAELPKFEAIAPRLGRFFAIGYNCALWPVKSKPKSPVANIGSGPIVVVGTTGDAATPLESSRKMAAALTDGRLIVATEDQHTGYGTSDCVTDRVDSYLIDFEVPDKETTCT